MTTSARNPLARRSHGHALLPLILIAAAACSEGPAAVAAVNRVELQVPILPLAIGTTYSAHAVAFDAHDREIAGRAVQWTVSDPAVATLGPNGGSTVEFSTMARGDFHLTATVDGVSSRTLVTVRRLCDFSAGARTALAYGSSVTGDLRVGDCETTDGRLYDLYLFEVPSDRTVLVEVTSASYDPWFAVHANSGVPLVQVAAAAGTRRAQASLAFQPRSYFVMVGSPGVATAGGYTFTVRDATAP